MRPSSIVSKHGAVFALGRTTSRYFPISYVLLIATCLWPNISIGQTELEYDPFEGIEEMVVVGSQGGAAMLEGMAVSAISFDEDALQGMGAQNIKDVAQFTPNLEIRSPFAASNPTLFIRGVGLRDFNANSSSSVAVYNDGVYMNSPSGQLAQLFDVQGINILRGPQGVRHARNASAGAILVTARKPTGTVGGYSRVTYGRLNQVNIEGALETPISPGLSVRIAGVMNVRDGHTVNRCAKRGEWSQADFNSRGSMPNAVFNACFNRDTVEPLSVGGQAYNAGIPGRTGNGVLSVFRAPGTGTSQAVTPTDIDRLVNDQDNWGGRVVFRYQPDDWEELDISLNFHGGQNRGQARQFQGIGYEELLGSDALVGPQEDIYGYFDSDTKPSILSNFLYSDPGDGDAFAGDYNNTGLEKLDLAGSNLVVNLELTDWGFESITAWEYNSRAVEANLDGNPFIALEIEFGNRAWQVSQSLNAAWDAGSDVTIDLGAYFIHEQLKVDNIFRLATTTAVIQSYEQETYAGAVYGQFDWSLSETLSLKGGVRWNFEDKRFEIVSGQAFSGPPPFFLNPAAAGSGRSDVTKDAPTGEIAFHYDPTSEVNFYFKLSRGWKGPHINGGTLNTQTADSGRLLEPVDPEEVTSLEFGTRADLWESRVTITGAIFYYDYKNLQIFQLKNEAGGVPTQQLLNAKDADLYGAELEITMTPLEGFVPPLFQDLQIFAAFGWLDSKYTDFKNVKINQVGNQAIPIVQDFSGNRLINSPEFSFAGNVIWMFDLDEYGKLGPRLDWTFKDEVFFNQNNREQLSQDALWLFNLRLDYRSPDELFEIGVWVRNLTDEVYTGDTVDLTSLSGKVLYAIGDPRTYGMTVGFNF